MLNLQSVLTQQFVNRPARLAIPAVCCILVIILLSACTSTVEKTYQYQTIDVQQLHAEMSKMVDSLLLINQSTTVDTQSLADQQRMVLDELDKIERIASSIGGNDVITNYSVINHYMGAFLYDVNLAQTFAAQNPPNLVPANRLIQSCLSCHSSL